MERVLSPLGTMPVPVLQCTRLHCARRSNTWYGSALRAVDWQRLVQTL